MYSAYKLTMFLGRKMHAFKGLLLISINLWIEVDYEICRESAPLKKNSGYVSLEQR